MKHSHNLDEHSPSGFIDCHWDSDLPNRHWRRGEESQTENQETWLWHHSLFQERAESKTCRCQWHSSGRSLVDQKPTSQQRRTVWPRRSQEEMHKRRDEVMRREVQGSGRGSGRAWQSPGPFNHRPPSALIQRFKFLIKGHHLVSSKVLWLASCSAHSVWHANVMLWV